MGRERASQPPITREVYALSDPEAQRRYTGARRAADTLPFLLPYLRQGMRLLDCGCGVGSITLDLAEAVAPGEVVGVDLDAGQLAEARAGSEARGLTNVRFEVADAYALPFPGESFDAAVAHTLLIHLRDPLRAVRELRRVLRPGGIVAIADGDTGTTIMSPSTPPLERGWELFWRVGQHNGAHLDQGRHARRVLREAGFARVEGHATVECFGNPEATRRFAAVLDRLWRSPATVEVVVGQGWSDRQELEACCAAVRAWGEHPAAFTATTRCGALGWVDDVDRSASP